MDKLKMHTPNRANENFRKLAELFPNAVTESIDENGEVVRAIDKDVLMQEINTKVVEGREERYQFTWPDKKKSVLLANAPINKTLRPCREESVGKDGTNGGFDSENLYIEGDNLEVLKLLQETYLGKIKMIYIDPPYNTGKDFIYKDEFGIGNEEWKEVRGHYDDEGNLLVDRLVKNSEANGRFHTDWLNIMYPRLKLAKDLLTDDGVIFISIDDNEQETLSMICDEIFNTSNFVGCIILQTATDNNPRQINTEHEYILCYAKNKSNLPVWFSENEKGKLIQEKYIELKNKFGLDISNIQTELRDWIKKNNDILQGVTHYDNVDLKGVFHDGDIANTVFGGYRYEVIHPITHKPCRIPEKGFRFSESTMKEMLENDDIMFGINENILIKPKKRLENAKDILRSIIYEDGRSSTKQFETLMDRDIFQNPKSPKVLERLINFIVNPGDIVLDFFSGSATTAEAVMQLNSKKFLNIKYIMVQLPENLDTLLKNTDSRNKKTIKNAIKFLDSISKIHLVSEIGKERIRRAGQKIKNEQLEKMRNEELEISNGKQLSLENSSFQTPNSSLIPDIGFRVLKCASSNMKDVYYNPAEFDEIAIDGSIDNIKEDRTPEDLLFQVMLDLGVLLSSKIEEKIIDGKKVFDVAEGFLVACFDDNITNETITEIAKQQPYYFVMRYSSIANDSVATNFEQIFATYSPDTVRKVL